MASIEPQPERLRAFLEQGDDTAPIVMINLLRYREQAAYPAGSVHAPCSGREAYQRYAEAATREVQATGGRLLWLGRVTATVIGPGDETWDDAILVQYPSRRAFLQMASRPEYREIAVHRTAALSDSRLIATTTVATELPTADG